MDGCLRGCLFSIIALVVLIGLCAAGYEMIGKGYIYGQIPTWRQMNPWVDYAVDVFEVDRFFAPPQKKPADAGGTERGATDKGALPRDIPAYPQPLREAFDITPQYTTVFQRVARSAAAEAYFRQTMPQLGWQLADDKKYGRTALVVWKKNNRTCVSEFVDRETTGEVWLRCSSK